VPSENVSPSEPGSTAAPTGDRRARKRAERTERLLDLAAELVEQHGVGGVTMAALAEAADYAPASLYTYFPSRSALLAALQSRALRTLGRVAADHLERWDALLAAEPAPPRVAALARLCAFSGLFLTAPEHHPREFRLQQQLLVTPGAEDPDDAERVAPAAFAVLTVPQLLLGAAVDVGALDAGPAPAEGDPTATAPTVPDGSVEPSLARTLAWVVALNGALLTDGLVTGLPLRGRLLGEQLTDTLLLGWGAGATALAEARARVATWPEPGTAATDHPAPRTSEVPR